jgi:hypothetical protein
MKRSRKRAMKKLGVSLFFVSSLAVAAYAATTWSHPPVAAECGVTQGSALPITAALELWRCSESQVSAPLPRHR